MRNKKELEIISSTDYNDRISLPADSLETVNTPDRSFKKYLELKDIPMNYFKGIFSILIEDIKEDDLKILYEDSKFIDTLSKLNNRFQDKYNKLIR